MLPPGLTVNPSSANGLGVCSPEQIGYAGAINQRQILRYDLPPKAFSGTFTVAYGGNETVPIDATATRAEVTQAIETLPGLGGNISVSGAQGSWIVGFIGDLAGTNVPLMAGSVSDNPSQKLTVTGEAGGFTLKYGGVSTKELPFNATAAEIQEALRAIPEITLENLYPGNIFVAATGVKGLTRIYTMIFAEDLAGAQPTLTATNTLTGPEAGAGVIPVPPPPARSLSVAKLGGFAPGTPHFTEDAANCPDAAKVGTVRIDAPGGRQPSARGHRLPRDPRQQPLQHPARLLHQRQRSRGGCGREAARPPRPRPENRPADGDDRRIPAAAVRQPPA